MLVGSCIWGTICRYQNEMPKVTRNAFIIGEVGNPVCCHGNQTVKLILWSSFSRIVLQIMKHFWYNMVEISSFIISDQHLVECMTCWRHHWANLHILKTWISLERKEIGKNNKQHFSSHKTTTCLCFKMASIGKMRFLS